uniref:hypothetical protein n=2 Tax=Dissulfurimicrobium sp. TaxID=2022436 RepID=UPI00404956D2
MQMHAFDGEEVVFPETFDLMKRGPALAKQQIGKNREGEKFVLREKSHLHLLTI